MLAAGAGSRLDASPAAAPKCLWSVAGASILERALHALHANGIERLVMVVGYQRQRIREAVARSRTPLQVEFVVNTEFARSENIVSLALAADAVDEPVLLLESDLLFHPGLLRPLLTPGRIAVSRLQPWMHGTRVRVGASGALDTFEFAPFDSGDSAQLRKTVNIYSLSRADWRRVAGQLHARIAVGDSDIFYEHVFAELLAAGEIGFQAVDFPCGRWYEVDTPQDLANAQGLFTLPA